MVFTGTTPSANACQLENNFTGQIEITDPGLKAFTGVLGSTGVSLYDDSLVLMYNFDNVASL